jgi:hypothetical protein
LSATDAAGIRRVKTSLHGRVTIDFQVVGGVSAQASCRSDPLLDDVGTLKQSVSIFDQARYLVFAREFFQLGSGSIVFVDVAHFHELAEAEVAHGQQDRAGIAALVLYEESALLHPLGLGLGGQITGVLGIDLFGESGEFVDVSGSRRPNRGDVLHDAVSVDDYRGSIRDSVVGQIKAKFLGDGTLGVEVGEQRKADASEAVSPIGVTVDAVNADTHDLGMSALETTLQRIQRWHFEASGRCEVEGIKEKEKMLLADEVGRRNLAAEMIGQSKLGCFAS